MVSLKVIIGITIILGIVALGTLVFYAISSDNSRRPTGPTGTPVPEFSVVFVNEREDVVYVVPTIGSVSDPHGWTNWDPVNIQSPGPEKYTPHTVDTTYRRVAPGESVYFTAFTQGMAASAFIIRTNCNEEHMICDKGDSNFVDGLDGPPGSRSTPSQWKRNPIPFKPAVDSRIELTWGCLYDDKRLCGINPSCITTPTTPGCTGTTEFVNAYQPGRFHKDGLYYADDSPIPIPLPVNSAGVTPALGSGFFFDISCVDGYTVPVIVEAQRPPKSQGSSATNCIIADPTNIVDNVNASPGEWQMIIDTSSVLLSKCPTDQVLWPAPKVVATVVGGGDGYNSHGGTTQFNMPYVTLGSPGVIGSPKFTAAFSQGAGSRTDLRVFRNPEEVQFLPGSSVDDVIACAGPCSILTKNGGGGNTMIYPITGTNPPAHVFPTATYLVDPVNRPLIPADPGVGEICCVPSIGSTIVTDSNLQCNTSTWWTDPPGIGPAGPPDPTAPVNYNFGFYASTFAPGPPAKPENPWWSATPPPIGSSANPYYTNPSGTVEYVNVVRGNVAGQFTKSRAYAYQHDDTWNTVVCTSKDPVNLLPSDARGPYYNHYRIRVRILKDA